MASFKKTLLLMRLVTLLFLLLLQTVFASENLDNNKWHSLAVRRRQKRLLIEVDDEKPIKSKFDVVTS